jgi:anaerobic ribonucleoside-triphosphate reductase
MPGQLKPDAVCPNCGNDLEAMVRTTSQDGVVSEFYHAKASSKARRKRRCVMKLSHEQDRKIDSLIHV